MVKRSVLAVIVLSIITLGIYSIYWFVVTKRELNTKGANIPTAWLIIIPIVNLWWQWKYFEGAEKVSEGKVNALLNFLLGIFVSSVIPIAICQNEYNKMNATPEDAFVPPSPVDNNNPAAQSSYPPAPVQPEQAPESPQIDEPQPQTVAPESPKPEESPDQGYPPPQQPLVQ